MILVQCNNIVGARNASSILGCLGPATDCTDSYGTNIFDWDLLIRSSFDICTSSVSIPLRCLIMLQLATRAHCQGCSVQFIEPRAATYLVINQTRVGKQTTRLRNWQSLVKISTNLLNQLLSWNTPKRNFNKGGERSLNQSPL